MFLIEEYGSCDDRMAFDGLIVVVEIGGMGVGIHWLWELSILLTIL